MKPKRQQIDGYIPFDEEQELESALNCFEEMQYALDRVYSLLYLAESLLPGRTSLADETLHAVLHLTSHIQYLRAERGGRENRQIKLN